MAKKSEWETVNSRGMCGDTCRMKVPGGWLYRERECQQRDGFTTLLTVVFVPEPDAPERELRHFGEIPL